MSKRKGIIVGSITAGVIASVIITQSTGFVQLVHAMQQDEQVEEKVSLQTDKGEAEEKEEEIGSIQLSPNLYVPEASTLINQPMDGADVVKTMNLAAVSLATKSGLAELSAGIAYHLGFSEEQLAPMQVQFYNENVAHYSKLVEVAGLEALEEADINVALEEFKSWVSGYKDAITQAIAEAEQEEEEARKQALIQSVDGKVVVEVDHSPSSTISDTQHVSYGIPELSDQYLTYEPYTAITAKTTPHYRLQTLATTDEHGYRIYQGAVAVALASAYGTTIGTLYDIKFADGKVMRAILGDNKSDKHTDSLNQYRDATGAYNGKSGNIVEIIFDTKNYANMNAINRKINTDYPQKVIGIVKVGIAEGFTK